MPDSATFLCECGTWLRIVIQGRGESMIHCPNPECSTQHTINGQIVCVLIEKDGKWAPYDWEQLKTRSGAA